MTDRLPFNLTRSQWQAACWRMAGAEWDRWLEDATWGLSSNAYAWAIRTEAEVLADRDARMAAAFKLYFDSPLVWTEIDAADAGAAIARGRDPRRTLALQLAVKEQEAMTKRTRRKLPCKDCGYGVGHGHSVFCGGSDGH